LEVEFGPKEISLHDGKVKLQVWDTSGWSRGRTVTPAYVKLAAGILLVYDVTSSGSLASIGSWLEVIQEKAHPHVAIIHIGNKADHEDHRRVSFEDGKSLAEGEYLLFIETSAREGTNVTEAFDLLTNEVLRRYDMGAFA
jgi:small GTP-binding protein